MESFEAFDVVLVPFPFTDRSTTKRRPALVLSNADYSQDTGQIICAMITTARRSSWRSDVPVRDLSEAGLPVPSKVRMKVFTLDSRIVLRRLGRLSKHDDRAVARVRAAIFI